MASPVRVGGAALALYSGTVTTAGTVTGGTVNDIGGATVLGVQAVLTYGSGGTTCNAYLQTSFDNAVTWLDIACFGFATSTATKIFTLGPYTAGTAIITGTTGSLTANTCVPGVLGDQLRVQVVSTGTYAGTTTLALSAVVKA